MYISDLKSEVSPNTAKTESLFRFSGGQTRVNTTLADDFVKEIYSAHSERSNHKLAIKKLIASVDDALDKNRVANTTARIPAAINPEILKTLIKDYNFAYKKSISYDMVLAFFEYYFSSRYSTPFRAKGNFKNFRNEAWKAGFVQMYSKTLQHFINTNDYNKVKQFLLWSCIIEIDENYGKGWKCKSYRIRDEYFGNSIKFKYVTYESLQYKRKCIEAKVRRINKMKADTTRKFMVQEVESFSKRIDFERADREIREMLENGTWNYKKDANEVLATLYEMKHGIFYFNVRDLFGHRFHSPLTNLPSIVFNWISTDEEFTEIDIKNSQFYFFAIVATESPEAIEELLKDDYNDKYNLNIKRFLSIISIYKERDDFKLFIEKVFDGTLYEYIAENLPSNLFYKSLTRKQAKNLVFRALFSNDKQSPKSKLLLKCIFPSLVELCNRLNTTREVISGYDASKTVPQILQRLESKLMIDTVCVEMFYNSNISSFFTVHDSIVCRAEDREAVVQIFYKVFDDLGFRRPKIKDK